MWRLMFDYSSSLYFNLFMLLLYINFENWRKSNEHRYFICKKINFYFKQKMHICKLYTAQYVNMASINYVLRCFFLKFITNVDNLKNMRKFMRERRLKPFFFTFWLFSLFEMFILYSQCVVFYRWVINNRKCVYGKSSIYEKKYFFINGYHIFQFIF